MLLKEQTIRDIVGAKFFGSLYLFRGCVLMGNFNEVREKSERMGSQFHQDTTRNFNHFIDEAKLTDIPLGGPHFTWTYKWGSKFSKLDRFLVMDDYLDSVLHISGMVLEKHIPYHQLIVLLEHRVDYGPVPFCIFQSCFGMDGFHTVVLSSW